MRPDKILSITGLAAKAGKVVSGEFSTERAVKNAQAYLVVVAADASENTKKKFKNMCVYKNIPYFEFAEKDQLGNCIGKQFRASLAVTDKNLAGSIIKMLEEREQLNNGGKN